MTHQMPLPLPYCFSPPSVAFHFPRESHINLCSFPISHHSQHSSNANPSNFLSHKSPTPSPVVSPASHITQQCMLSPSPETQHKQLTCCYIAHNPASSPPADPSSKVPPLPLHSPSRPSQHPTTAAPRSSSLTQQRQHSSLATQPSSIHSPRTMPSALFAAPCQAPRFQPHFTPSPKFLAPGFTITSSTRRIIRALLLLVSPRPAFRRTQLPPTLSISSPRCYPQPHSLSPSLTSPTTSQVCNLTTLTSSLIHAQQRISTSKCC